MDVQKNILMIRHLPAELLVEDQEGLLKHFGALKARCMGNKGRMKHVAFANFPNEKSAEEALHRLHQLKILGSCLVVEFAKKQDEKFYPSMHKDSSVCKVDDEAKKIEDARQEDKSKLFEQEVTNKKKIADVINTISSKWGLEYNFNPRLQYMYPAPSASVLTNIAHALVSVPRFYVQVLHLMNKMNLPAPFGPITPTPPLPAEQPPVRPAEPQVLGEGDMEVSSTEESEIESDGGDDKDAKKKELPTKRQKKSQDPNRRTRKKVKLQNVLPAARPVVENTTSSLPNVTPAEIFEQPQAGPGSKKIEFKLPSTIVESLEKNRQAPSERRDEVPSILLPVWERAPALIENLKEDEDEPELQQIPSLPPLPPAPPSVLVDQPIVAEGGFGKLEPQLATQESEEEEEEEWGATEFISSKKLRRGKISKSEMRDLSVYKNYNPGDPTTRLYIKNLAKQVTEKDLHYVFGKYVHWDKEDEKNMFDIRLMKEGRMKGQAFVTLPREDKAKNALEDTNGFVMHGKPIVVQFARSAKPKEKEDQSKRTSRDK